MSLPQDYILQVRGLTKTFAGVTALNKVQLNLRKGEVHALMGENGAGKSTFMKLLIGLLKPDSGEIIFDGKPLTATNVSETLRKGISMIHQEILIVPELTVAQTIFLGRETTRLLPGWLDERTINDRSTQLLAQLGVVLNPRTRMKHLSVAQMQLVEIAKAISNQARVIIMDEPTSAIADKEVEKLFRIIDDLKQQGVAIIYISHKMDEIFAIADTITVLRDGQYIATERAAELDSNRLIALMVGRTIDTLFPARTAHKGQEVLSVREIGRQGKFSAISFVVRAGEILGIAGLMGAGRTELARALFGLDPIDAGELIIDGESVRIQSPRDAIRHGIGYVSEDRKGEGFVPNLSVRDNVTLASLANHAIGPFIQKKSEVSAASTMIGKLRIKAVNMDQRVTHLSGGNQQKVVIGKVLLASPALVILDEPTRGVDIGAKAEIYALISQLVANGLAVIMISSELPELLGLSDRILVLAKGKQTALLSRQEASPETIMHHAMAR